MIRHVEKFASRRIREAEVLGHPGEPFVVHPRVLRAVQEIEQQERRGAVRIAGGKHQPRLTTDAAAHIPLALHVQTLDGLLQGVRQPAAVAPDEIPARRRVPRVTGQQLVQAHQLGEVAGVHDVFVQARIRGILVVIPVGRDIGPDPDIEHPLAQVAQLLLDEFAVGRRLRRLDRTAVAREGQLISQTGGPELDAVVVPDRPGLGGTVLQEGQLREPPGQRQFPIRQTLAPMRRFVRRGRPHFLSEASARNNY